MDNLIYFIDQIFDISQIISLRSRKCILKTSPFLAILLELKKNPLKVLIYLIKYFPLKVLPSVKKSQVSAWLSLFSKGLSQAWFCVFSIRYVCVAGHWIYFLFNFENGKVYRFFFFKINIYYVFSHNFCNAFNISITKSLLYCIQSVLSYNTLCVALDKIDTYLLLYFLEAR